MLDSIEPRVFDEWIAQWKIWYPDMFQDDSINLEGSLNQFRRLAGG